MKAIVGLAVLAALVVVARPVGATTARPKAVEVEVQFSAYGPSQLDVLPGQAVKWSNVSPRTHTVTSDTGVFDSGHLGPGDRFQVIFSRPGIYRYHCTIHSSIVGEVDVRRVILDQLPTAAVPAGDRVDFTGVTADPSKPVRIQERAGRGGRFTTLATVKPNPSGRWRVAVRAATTGDYRAAVGADVSETRRMIVGVRKVELRPAPGGFDVSVTPDAPYAPILVERYIRERFGWWPVARARLDYVSDAQIRVRGRPARFRVVLVDHDGWTPIATSRPISLN